jgi:hypothetical protein
VGEHAYACSDQIHMQRSVASSVIHARAANWLIFFCGEGCKFVQRFVQIHMHIVVRIRLCFPRAYCTGILVLLVPGYVRYFLFPLRNLMVFIHTKSYNVDTHIYTSSTEDWGR